MVEKIVDFGSDGKEGEAMNESLAKRKFGRISPRSVTINALLNMTRTFVSLLFPLITFPYASRVLLPEGIGRVNFAMAVVSYFSILASLGIENYGVREAAKVRDDRVLLSGFVKEILSINLISSAVAYILLAVAMLCVSKLSEYKSLLRACSATILFTTFGVNWLYSAVEDYLYITVRSIAFHIVSLVMLFVFVHTEGDYVKYAAISVFSNVGSNILNFIHSRKFIDFKICGTPNLKKHIRPIFVLFATAVAVKVYTALDVTMLGFIKGDREVGVYTVATKINGIVLSLIVAVSTVLLPRLSYYAKQKNDALFQNLSYKGIGCLLLLAIPCVAGLSLLSAPVIHVLSGSEYNAAILPMRIMNPTIVVIGISNFIGIQLFMPLNKERWTLYSVLVGAVANFLLNAVLIPNYGASGAAIATVLAECFVTAVQLLLARRYIPIRPVVLLFLKYLANSALMVSVVFVCIRSIKTEWIELFVGVLFGALIYFFLLFIERDSFVMGFMNSLKVKLLKKEKI